MRRRRTTIPADRARGGEVVLKKRWERVVFVAGLAGCVVLAAAVALARLWS